jgi:hypothetical protein
MPYGTVNADVIQTSTSGGILGAGNASIMKNRIINGAMVINQRATTVSASDSGWQYAVDRWACYQNLASSKFTLAGSSTATTGFTNSLLATSSSAYTVGASEFFTIRQPIEGFNTADLGWGTANAKTVTLSFWVRSSVTGTFAGFIQNANDGSRTYPFTYTISSANTFEQKSITIAGDTSGTWLTNNGAGPAVCFSMGCGSTYLGTANAWTGSTIFGVTGQTNLVATSGATWYVTGVQLEVGSSATGFEYVNYQTSLANCQRYFSTFGGSAFAVVADGGTAYSTTDCFAIIKTPVTMRSIPTLSVVGSWVWNDYVTAGIGVGTLTVRANSSTNDFIYIDSNNAISGLTEYRAYRLVANNNANARINANSEL